MTIRDSRNMYALWRPPLFESYATDEKKTRVKGIAKILNVVNSIRIRIQIEL